VPGRIELDVSYAAQRPWVPRRAQFAIWANAALRAAARSRPADAAERATARVAARFARDVTRVPTDFATRVVISVRVVGAARSRSLNAQYRHKNRPTNVLSFSGAGISPDGRNYLGELVICAPVVAHEAESQGKTLEAHWAHMTVHGTLHLLGFDHQRSAEARKMSRREVQILDRLGFSDPYA
jgi:probable rRNA maturation factor